MKTPQSKTNDGRATAAAENVSHVQPDSIQLFTDNRPEAVAQRRLKALVNNSAPVKQMAAWKAVMQRQGALPLHVENEGDVLRNTDPAPPKRRRIKPMLQLKSGMYFNVSAGAVAQLVLRNDVLNVAGEDHDESDPRMDSEKAFCREKTESSNYWEEGKFMVSDEKGALPADTPHLQVSFEIASIRHLLGDLLTAEGSEYTGLAKKIERRVAEAEALYVNYGALDAELKTSPFQTLLVSLLELKAKIGSPDLKKEGEMFLGSTPTDSWQKTSAARGVAMHSAAQAQYQKKGVWKIGQAHVDQIETLGERLYNLMSQDEFNTEYKVYDDAVKERKRKEEEARKTEEEARRKREEAQRELEQREERKKIMESLRAGDKKDTPASEAERARKERLKKALADDDDTPPARASDPEAKLSAEDVPPPPSGAPPSPALEADGGEAVPPPPPTLVAESPPFPTPDPEAKSSAEDVPPPPSGAPPSPALEADGGEAVPPPPPTLVAESPPSSTPDPEAKSSAEDVPPPPSGAPPSSTPEAGPVEAEPPPPDREESPPPTINS